MRLFSMGDREGIPTVSNPAGVLGGVVSQGNVLSSIGLVVHEEELDILDVADEESLVAGGHHVAGLLVGAIADLEARSKSRLVSHLID